MFLDENSCVESCAVPSRYCCVRRTGSLKLLWPGVFFSFFSIHFSSPAAKLSGWLFPAKSKKLIAALGVSLRGGTPGRSGLMRREWLWEIRCSCILENRPGKKFFRVKEFLFLRDFFWFSSCVLSCGSSIRYPLERMLSWLGDVFYVGKVSIAFFWRGKNVLLVIEWKFVFIPWDTHVAVAHSILVLKK